MSKDIECPYCEYEQDIDHEDGCGYQEDTVHQQECCNCGKSFVYTTSISLTDEERLKYNIPTIEEYYKSIKDEPC